MHFIRKLKLGTKIFILLFLIMAAFAGVMATTSFSKIEQGIRTEVSKSAKDTALITLQYFETKYPGEWKIQNGELFKGDLKLSGHNEILDELRSYADAHFTVFQDSTRVITTIEQDGKRAVGTKVSTEVGEAVLHNQRMFLGEADILGVPYQTAYIPLIGEDQEVIGIWFAGYSEESISSHVNQATFSFWIILAASLLVAAGLVAAFSWSISRRLYRIQSAVEAAGSGDFTVEVRDSMQDEIARLVECFNLMRNSLRDLVITASSTSNQVASTAEELSVSADETSKATEHVATSMQDIAVGADRQLAVTDESVQLIQWIGQGVKHIYSSTSEVERYAAHTSQLSAEGGEAVQNTSANMRDIQTAVISTHDSMHLLENRSVEIEEMAKLIGDIATQTNLLALNAGIEAARAGESGRGFAVVAKEVKKLAEVSRSSAGQVAEKVQDIRNDISRTVHAMNHVIELVQQGMESTDETNRKFKHILTAVSEMDRKVKETAEISEQISSQVDGVGDTVQSLSQIAKDSSFGVQAIAASSEEQLASMQEVSASSAYLAKLAEELQSLLIQFKVD